MPGLFGCPECGEVVSARGTSVGRRVRCQACGTLVEIPFLPRSAGRNRRGRRGLVTAIAAGVGLVVAIVMVIVAVGIAFDRGRSARSRQVAEAIARSEQAEAAGQFHDALTAVESALKIAKPLGREACQPLKARRDRLALRESEASLAAIGETPDQVAALRFLRARVEADPARDEIRDRVADALTTAIGKRAEADLSEASRAVVTHHPEVALSLCEGVAKMADELGFERAGGVREAARAIADKVIAQYGVVLTPVTGDFLTNFGSAKLHAASLHPAMVAALRSKGYFPKPEKTAFAASWDEHAPYKFGVEIIERADGTFFQTPLQTTRVNAYLSLKRGQAIVWESRPFGKTRVPPPDMSAFEMSHLSLAKERDDKVEKRLYDDARIDLADNIGKAIRKIPECKPAG